MSIKLNGYFGNIDVDGFDETFCNIVQDKKVPLTSRNGEPVRIKIDNKEDFDKFMEMLGGNTDKIAKIRIIKGDEPSVDPEDEILRKILESLGEDLNTSIKDDKEDDFLNSGKFLEELIGALSNPENVNSKDFEETFEKTSIEFFKKDFSKMVKKLPMQWLTVILNIISEEMTRRSK